MNKNNIYENTDNQFYFYPCDKPFPFPDGISPINPRDFEKSDITENQCLHMSCPECHGSVKKQNGTMCVHMISCP